jgi:hypothetical protein
MAMACAMGSMSAAYPKVVKTGVVTPVSLFATLVSVVVLVGNLISLLLTGLTSLVGLARLVRLKTTLATRTAMGD